MVVKESYGDQNTEPHKHDIDEDEEEETLSFYEFLINSDADAWEDSSRESHENSSSKTSQQEDDDCFEFFSEELRKKAIISYPPESIIFCGKIIPYKQPISRNPKNVDRNIKEKKNRRKGLFRWKWSFTSSNKSRTSRKNGNNGEKHPCTTKNQQKELQTESPKYNTKKRSKMHGFSLHKKSILKSAAKRRWHLYLFGITKFRSEMQLRDIKNRQNRRGPPSFRLSGLEGGDDKKSKSNGGWGLLRALCCSGHHQSNAVVKASVGRIPQV